MTTAPSTEQELQPCPFCGGIARLTTGRPKAVDEYFISCFRCSFRFDWQPSKTKAIIAWNTRSTQPFRPQGEEAQTVHACLTPETYYEYGLDGPYTLRVCLRFPFNIEHWGKGTSAVTEGPKLQRYDQRAEERDRISDLIHDRMEVVGADAYRVMRGIDRLLGTDNVERGIAAAKRRRERRPTRDLLPVKERKERLAARPPTLHQGEQEA